MSSEVKELLTEDYRYVSDSIWKNEQSGETRVNLFIGLVAIVIGSMVSLGKELRKEVLFIFILSGLISLLSIGAVILIRILKRNRNTDIAKLRMDHIRQTFKDH